MGRLRYIGLILYDADRVLEAAATRDERDLYEAQRRVFLDPGDPAVVAAAERSGIPRDWVDAAARSPVYALINTYRVALPLHPEYRTLPMVWFIPPLSPVVDVVRDTGYDAEERSNLLAATAGTLSRTRPATCPPRGANGPVLVPAGYVMAVGMLRGCVLESSPRARGIAIGARRPVRRDLRRCLTWRLAREAGHDGKEARDDH